MKPDFSKSEISQSSVRPDPQNPNYTIPRTYGVYHLSAAKESISTKSFRYGNHPIRMQELQREFGSVKLVALYTNRNIATQHAAHANKAT